MAYLCPKCPTVVDKPGRCSVHRAEADQQRGTRQQRGYGAEHDGKRAQVRKRIDAGGVRCWRCGGLFQPGDPFDLGHDDFDRSIYRGAECTTCNRSAAGRLSHGLPPTA